MSKEQKVKLGSTLGIGFLALLSIDRFRYSVEPGHIAIKFSKFSGLKDKYYKEGWHLIIPYFERPIIYNVQTKLKSIKASTANKDMQNVILNLRVLYRPRQDKLCEIYRYVGIEYDERVLPSIVNEVLRAVIAQYSASQLLAERDQVSNNIRRQLEERASIFHIVIDDVSISELTFGKEYLDAIEAKQIAQQEAERAKYLVEQAKDIKKSIIIKAQADARSIQLVGETAKQNPAYLDMKKIEYSKDIALVLAESRNHIMLNSDILMMNQLAPKINSI